MRTGLAIVLAVLGTANIAVAQSTLASSEAGTSQLMNAAFLRGQRLDSRTDTKIADVLATRDLPLAINLNGERFALSLTPHAGLGMSNFGNSAEAGAVLTFGPKGPDQSLTARLDRMGVHDGADFGERGRWYVFAAASGRAVGLNVLKGPANSWDQSWSQDPSSALIGDAQLGLGWRKGAMQTSLGYIHREIKGDHMVWGQQARDDSMVAFSLSVKPRH